MHEANAYRRALVFEMPLDGFLVRVEIDENFRNAGAGAEREPDIEQRPAADRRQAFRDGVGERTQAGSISPGEQERFHSEFSWRQ